MGDVNARKYDYAVVDGCRVGFGPFWSIARAFKEVNGDFAAGPPSPRSRGAARRNGSGRLGSGAFVAENTINVRPQYLQVPQVARGAIDRVTVQNQKVRSLSGLDTSLF